MSDALLAGLVLLIALGLFAWDRVRHDLVAITALGACLVLGLVAPDQALQGFSDPAVVVVAAVLIIGRAIELTGVAAAATEKLAALKAPFSLQLSILLLTAAVLSAFMNNIAALAITMPAVASVCRASGRPAGAGLMPLAFATILGGMTTLIGTPANLILSSVRREQLGEPFGFFDMTPVGVAVAGMGLLYLCLVGWRLTPSRKGEEAASGGRNVFELAPPRPASEDEAELTPEALFGQIKEAGAHVLGVVRRHRRLKPDRVDRLASTDRILVVSSIDPWEFAKKVGCELTVERSTAQDAVTSRVAVAHGSPLIGRPYDTIAAETDRELRVVAAGPRAAGADGPLGAMEIRAGDQLVVHGPAERLESYLRYGRLLELDRKSAVAVQPRRAALALAIYAAAVIAAVGFGLPTALTFAAAAAGLAALRFLPSGEIYSSIDWPAIVLLGAMIPVGQSFETSGAAAIVADWLGVALGDSALWVAAAATTAATLLLSIFLNNVATAVIMGPVAIAVANQLGVSPDALLLAVLIGASSDFLTPIGHQNNLLVMGPGGYKFADYGRVGAFLSILVVATSAAVISAVFG
ncbi:SLC13 family permease [Phenylobacterium sp.]|uniref:SLC13 family permease n=1 Tax=Phenylobacterium sp. TaxID=1871053 RepID=UPI0019CBC1A8|nr:SLC13 family permease [Phenylobacterium sp.]MBC7167242.1 SLC13/DASS family transporter [Phenylobacterium sp.]